MTPWIARAAAAAGIGLLAAACSSGSSTSASSTSTSGTATSSPASSSPAAAAPSSSPAATGQASGAATVSLATISGIPGKALVGSNGRTLYLFQADKNSTSACTGACAAAWPPDTVTASPQAGSGVSQSLLGTIIRADGTMQLTYNGHPLYYFAADTAGGTAHGQAVTAFGAEWYVVGASGSKIDTS
jgi:predicted lipoprotein with Yx(FWY)xxD motif